MEGLPLLFFSVRAQSHHCSLHRDKSGVSEKRFYREFIRKAGQRRCDTHLIPAAKDEEMIMPTNVDDIIRELKPCCQRKKVIARASQLAAEEVDIARTAARARKLFAGSRQHQEA